MTTRLAPVCLQGPRSTHRTTDCGRRRLSHRLSSHGKEGTHP